MNLRAISALASLTLLSALGMSACDGDAPEDGAGGMGGQMSGGGDLGSSGGSSSSGGSTSAGGSADLGGHNQGGDTSMGGDVANGDSLWSVEGEPQGTAYTCETDLPDMVFGVTAESDDFKLEIGSDQSKTDAYTLPQTNNPQLALRLTRLSDGAVYESNVSGTLEIDLVIDMGAKLVWTVDATLEYTEGGTSAPASLDFLGEFSCSP